MIRLVDAAFPSAASALPDQADLAARGVGFRSATAADLPYFEALFSQHRAREPALATWPDPMRRAFLADQFRLQHTHFTRSHPRGDFLAVTHGSRTVGRFYIDRSVAPWALIEIGLDTDAQGRGLGSALVIWLQKAAARTPAGAVSLFVALDNPRAEKLYRRLGFTEIPSPAPTHRRMIWRA